MEVKSSRSCSLPAPVHFKFKHRHRGLKRPLGANNNHCQQQSLYVICVCFGGLFLLSLRSPPSGVRNGILALYYYLVLNSSLYPPKDTTAISFSSPIVMGAFAT